MKGFWGSFLSVFLLLNFAASGAPAKRSADVPGYRGVQLTRGPQNHLVLRGTINGRTASFLVDTGADISFLRANRAAEFGVRRQEQTVYRKGRTFPLGTISGLAVGNMTLGETTMALVGAAQLRGTLPGGGTADGVLGLDLLSRHKAVINCRTRQIFFKTDPNSRLSLGATTRGLGFVQIGLQVGRRGDLTVPCTLRSRPGRLIVDTGAFVTLFDDNVARSFELVRRPSRITAGGVDGRVRPVELARVDDLNIGGVPIAPQSFAVTDLFGEQKKLRVFTGINRLMYYTPRTPGAEIFGILGNELLDSRRAIIDLENMSLFLK